tara:strand:+ start:1652 stop:3016 length:1365 start_codon:yes stop_codon:yes gene_type:complete
MAIAAAALRLGTMLGRAGGAIAKGGKLAMRKGGTVLKKSKKIAGNVKKIAVKKRKINKDTFMSKEKTRKKKLEKDKRREEEESLEQTKKSKQKPSAKKTMSRGGGILQRLISFISTIIVGWVLVNLPKIIDSVKGVIKKIKDIYDKIVGLFGSFGEFFSGIKDIIGNVINKLKNIDFSKIGEKIKEKITGLKDGFTNMIDKIKGGLNILRGKKKEDPNKLAKSGFAGDSKAQQGDAQKKISESDSKLSEVSTETDTLSKDTNTLSTDFDDKISKGKDELKKAGLDANIKTGDEKKVVNPEKVMNKKDNSENVKVQEFKKKKKDIKTTSEQGSNVNIKTTSEQGSNVNIKTLDGKTFKSGDGGYAEQFKKAKGTLTDSMKNITADSSKFIQKRKYSDLTSSITPKTMNKNIVVDNIIAKQPVVTAQSNSSSGLIVVEKQLNNTIKENLLLDAAYT